jgi:hypothetical protein
MNQGLNIDVHLYMEKGMYARLVERAQELGMPLSAIVRDAVVQYFANIPESQEVDTDADPHDPLWGLPRLSETYGDLRTLTPTSFSREGEQEGQEERR